MFELTGVERDTSNGVLLHNAVLFARGGKIGLTTHLFGYRNDGAFQVCSPIRSVQEEDSAYVFVTRSYNKYIVYKTDFYLFKMDFDPINYVNFSLREWLGTDKVVKIFNIQTDKDTLPLFDKKPTQFEKELYGIVEPD